MAKSNQMCIGSDLRDFINDKRKDDTSLIKWLDKIPDCSSGKQKRAKRAPSKYNQFVSSCMKDIGKSVPVTERMKTCAVKWKKQKK